MFHRFFLAVVFAVASLQYAGGHHHPLHCAKWKSDCDKYQERCEEKPASEKTWKSCCQLMEYTPTSDEEPLSSGVYTIESGTYSTARAWCDLTTNGGGWLVLVRRESDKVNFMRLMADYEDGFGDLEHDFWYGLRAMQALTSRGTWEMRVDMYEHKNDTESTSHAHYDSFQLGRENYTLRLGKFNGSDDMLQDNLRQFNEETFKARVTEYDDTHGCTISKGGWWYAENCEGMPTPGTVLTKPNTQLRWYDPDLINLERTFEKYEMKIRPTSCASSEKSD